MCPQRSQQTVHSFPAGRVLVVCGGMVVVVRVGRRVGVWLWCVVAGVGGYGGDGAVVVVCDHGWVSEWLVGCWYDVWVGGCCCDVVM